MRVLGGSRGGRQGVQKSREKGGIASILKMDDLKDPRFYLCLELDRSFGDAAWKGRSSSPLPIPWPPFRLLGLTSLHTCSLQKRALTSPYRDPPHRSISLLVTRRVHLQGLHGRANRSSRMKSADVRFFWERECIGGGFCGSSIAT